VGLKEPAQDIVELPFGFEVGQVADTVDLDQFRVLEASLTPVSLTTRRLRDCRCARAR
jgi:hypothetical protein